MKRHTILSMLVVMAASCLAVTSGARRALAQNPDCCDFIVNATNVPAACFPIDITTDWGGLAQTDVITAPGFRTFPITIGCPPAPPLVSVTMTSTAGCCLTWTYYYCGGCLFIEVIGC